MKFSPIQTARIQFDDDGTPVAPAFGDVYHARAGALEQAQAVFLAGNGLPQRWQGRDRFTVLETGFGLGHTFLATWQAWRNDPQRSRRLHFVSIECHPPTLTDLQQAHRRHLDTPLQELCAALHQQWPLATPDIHRIFLDDDRVVLDLVWADVQEGVRELDLQADALYLDGFDPKRNPDMWDARLFKALARLSAPDGTAATWSASRTVRDGLQAAGFVVQRRPGFAGKRERVEAVRRPELRASLRRAARQEPPPYGTPRGTAPTVWPVVVVGGGLAGAACALALARRGIQCLVFDRHPEPAQEASGNAAGLVHGVHHREDGAHARLLRAASQYARDVYHPALTTGAVEGALNGLVRRVRDTQGAALQAELDALGLPASYVQVADAATETGLSALSGEDAWFYPQGGWISPGQWVRWALQRPGVEWQGGVEVAGWHRVQGDEADADGEAGCWALMDGAGRVVAQAQWVVLAHPRLGLPSDLAMGLHRGQITRIPRTALAAPGPRLPVSGDGYALTMPNGDVWCGATQQRHDADASVREADHAWNLQRWQALSPQPLQWDRVQGGTAALHGRVGWRLQLYDRLPLVGPLPAAEGPGDGSAPGRSLGHARSVHEIDALPGLLQCTGLGSRGITLAPLLGECVASMMLGEPMPLPRSVLEAIDPRRGRLKRLRRSAAGATSA